MKSLFAMGAKGFGEGALDWGLLFLRLSLAGTFIYHGYGKLAGGLPQFTGYLKQLGVPAPALFAVLAAVAEFFGGIALLLGLFTPIAAAGIAIVMVVAILKVHLPNGWNMLNNGMEAQFAWLMMALCVMVAGAGRFSVDAWLSREGNARSEEVSHRR